MLGLGGVFSSSRTAVGMVGWLAGDEGVGMAEGERQGIRRKRHSSGQRFYCMDLGCGTRRRIRDSGFTFQCPGSRIHRGKSFVAVFIVVVIVVACFVGYSTVLAQVGGSESRPAEL